MKSKQLILRILWLLILFVGVINIHVARQDKHRFQVDTAVPSRITQQQDDTLYHHRQRRDDEQRVVLLAGPHKTASKYGLVLLSYF